MKPQGLSDFNDVSLGSETSAFRPVEIADLTEWRQNWPRDVCKKYGLLRYPTSAWRDHELLALVSRLVEASRHDRIRELTKAGALIAAEIDRLTRAALKGDSNG